MSHSVLLRSIWPTKVSYDPPAAGTVAPVTPDKGDGARVVSMLAWREANPGRVATARVRRDDETKITF